ncbi:hypothetical protein GCM10027444_30340 [Actinopolyspora lacussalsi]
MSETPSVFCTVTAVTAVMPCTPQEKKVRRSACMPALPPESDPAIVRAVGGAVSLAGRIPVPVGVESIELIVEVPVL